MLKETKYDYLQQIQCLSLDTLLTNIHLYMSAILVFFFSIQLLYLSVIANKQAKALSYSTASGKTDWVLNIKVIINNGHSFTLVAWTL
jgi:hypothetical protein